MLKIDKSIKDNYSNNISNAFKTCERTFDFKEFLEIALKEDANNDYPKEILIPNTLDEMILGNIGSSRTLDLNDPPTYEGLPIWRCSSLKGVKLDPGYLNGDKRFLSKYCLDSSTKAHAIMGGMTGAGKSVAMNAIIMSLCFRYAPWEVKLWMSDSKLTGFKPYGIEHHIPHIKVISATYDTGYLLSMLESFKKDMEMTQSIFGACGVDNIEDFRKKTGLTLPRNILFMDEFQAALATSGRSSNKVVSVIDAIGRLGRATGFHMFLASQEVASDIKSVLGNIATRFCLKSKSEVSTMLLGNTQGFNGSDVGVGRVYVTDDPGPDESNNSKFRIPFMNKTLFSELGKHLDAAGDKIGFREDTNFYNEDELFDDEKLNKLIGNKSNKSSLVLGVPSFINSTPDKFEVDFSCQDYENTFVYAPSASIVYNIFRTFYNNAVYDTNSGTRDHRFYIADKTIIDDLDMSSPGFYAVDYVQDANTPTWNNIRIPFVIRKLILETEDSSFNNPVYDDEETNKLCEDILDPKWITPTTRSRMYYMRRLVQQPRFKDYLNINSSVIGDAEMFMMNTALKGAIVTILQLGSKFLTNKVSLEDFRPCVYHIVGYNKIRGLGRSENTKITNNLRCILDDCNQCNITFVMYATTVSALTPIVEACRFFVLDNAENKSNSFKLNEYPRNVPDKCAVFFDRPNELVRVFKKLKVLGR